MRVTDLPPDTWHPFKTGMFEESRYQSTKIEDTGRLFVLLRGYDADNDCPEYTIVGVSKVPHNISRDGRRVVGVLRLDVKGAVSSLGLPTGTLKEFEEE